MVHIVGAGPGDPELITMKGHRYLAEADVVIYAGSLVNPVLLDYCRKDAKIYNSAKMTLEEVVDVVKKAEADDCPLTHGGSRNLRGYPGTDGCL